MGVSNPTNFVHQVHVGFDPVSGAFTGLPEQWTRLLTSSAITKEDYAKNPQAVLDVLEFYTDIQKRERDDYGLGTQGMGMTDGSVSRGARGSPVVAPPTARFGGTGLAGQSPAYSSNGPPPATFPKSYSPAPTPQSLSSAAPLPRPPPASLHSPPAQSNRERLEVSPSLAVSGASPQPPLRPAGGKSRPALTPGRAPPPTPLSSDSSTPAVSGLKPLLTSPASRSNLKEPASSSGSSSRTPSPSTKASAPAVPGQKPLQLSSQHSKITGGAGKPTAAPAIAPKPSLAVKKTERTEGDRRISTMTEAQIMSKLRSVCSPQDPNTLYSKIRKVGQGASGSVYVAKVLATSAKVAIKQMDLSNQPRKELIVNEILVMKESQHPNIVNFLDSFLVRGAELWVVMEYMEGGALTDVIDSNSLAEEQIASISNEVSDHVFRLIAVVARPLTAFIPDLQRSTAPARSEHYPPRY